MAKDKKPKNDKKDKKVKQDNKKKPAGSGVNPSSPLPPQ